MPGRTALVSLFLISAFSISFETSLTRYFAVALSSQYSYWIISIAMLGYSVSGVVLSLFERFFRQRRTEISFLIPLALIVFTTAAFAVLRDNPFNPLEFQNEALWKSQIAYVLLYYLGLFPVFFLSGTFVGLNFLVFYRQIGRVYAVDLFGAGAGALAILGLMFLLHPYHLPSAMLALLFLVFVLNVNGLIPGWRSWRSLAILLVALAGTASGIIWVISVSPLSVPDFKPLHSILGIAGHTIERSVLSPSGFSLVVDDYTERDDLPMTNDYGKLRIGAPPRSFGVYIDAARVAPLLKDAPEDMSYVGGALSHFPYTIRSHPRVFLIGTNGGFQALESAHGGAGLVLASEEQRVMYKLVKSALRRTEPQLLKSGVVDLVHGSVFSVLRHSRGAFDIIEIASDYLGQGNEASYAFTRESVELCLDSLRSQGILSIPVDISELNGFALKVLTTVRQALVDLHVADPEAHVMAYRTAWTCQILVSKAPFSATDVTALKKYCFDRSFDTPYYPGIDPGKVSVWNELPPISFDEASATPTAPEDPLMLDMISLMRGSSRPVSDSRYFNLAPASLDRPDFFSISRISKLGVLLSHASLLPGREVGYLLNVYVLAQALVLGMIVLAIPAIVLRGRSSMAGPDRSVFARTLLYFSFLGLGYLFVELAFIQKLSVFLGSATTSFAVTLSSMLVFSGLGSWSSSAARTAPRAGLMKTLPGIIAGILFMIFALDPLVLAAIGLPEWLKLLIAVVFVGPLAFAMGRPFPLGNAAVGVRGAHLVPWAWAVNGAFSVISTPLANMVSATLGWRVVFAAALALYFCTLPVFPLGRQKA